jgi:hypothetical protein
MSKTSLSNNLTAAAAGIAGAGTVVLLDNDNNYHHKKDNYLFHQNNHQICPEHLQVISFWEFIHLYTVGEMPIIDFFFIYIILYISNAVYFGRDQRLVLLLTIPITVIYNLITNREMKISWFIIIIMAISIYFLLTINFSKK